MPDPYLPTTAAATAAVAVTAAVWLAIAHGAPASLAGHSAPATTVIATSCQSFETDVRRSFAAGGAAVLNGTFAPGDHVHLAIDLRGATMTWALTGNLGAAPQVTPSFWSRLFRTSRWTNRIRSTYSATDALVSIVYAGDAQGYGRWHVDVDVVRDGEGSLQFDQTSAAKPRIAIARCTPRTAPLDPPG